MAGSDTNKTAIVEKGCMGRLIKLSAIFSEDPSVLQEVRELHSYGICNQFIYSPHNRETFSSLIKSDWMLVLPS